jgi:hypothetical protein
MGLHVGRLHQANGMAEAPGIRATNDATKRMFNTDRARWQLLEEAKM